MARHTARTDDEYAHLAPLLRDYAHRRQFDDNDKRRLRERLLADFRPVALHIAKRYASGREHLDDLEQVAVIGLLNAFERFEPDRGANFLSFAVPTITGEVLRHLRDATWTVHTPRRIKTNYLAVNGARARLSPRLGRNPSAVELARDLEMGLADVIEASRVHFAYRPSSLDTRPATGSDPVVARLASSGAEYDRAEDRHCLRRALATLSERERRIVAMRYVEEKHQAEIAEAVGVSQVHVSRLLRRSLDALRRELGPDIA